MWDKTQRTKQKKLSLAKEWTATSYTINTATQVPLNFTWIYEKKKPVCTLIKPKDNALKLITAAPRLLTIIGIN